MDFNRIYAVFIAAACLFTLPAAGFAADGTLLKNHAHMLQNAGFAGGAKIPLAPAPAIDTAVVEVAAASSKKKGELEDLGKLLFAEGLSAEAEFLNQYASRLKIKPNPENLPVHGAVVEHGDRHLRFVMVRKLAEEKEPLFLFAYQYGDTVWIYVTDQSGKLRFALKNVSDKGYTVLKVKDSVAGFTTEKVYWLKWAKDPNRQTETRPAGE